ncbi:MAG TPA: glycosyltransferase [Pyrinomonadaceae bacterium]|nr:glycosyltransferase [Pyrinomonadaceae bacterium]
MAISALYICYFGLNEPLVQTQVLPYLRELATAGINLHLLTFEPRLHETRDLKQQEEELRRQGIAWSYLPYHKRPSLLATLYDIVAGARFIARLARREGVQLLHARAHMPLAMALLAQRFVRAKLLFDIRGLMAEEYADAGVWTTNSITFRMVKRLERAGIRRADGIVVLTNRMRDWLVAHSLKPSDQIEVIPCCVELVRFDETIAQSDPAHSPENRFEVIYAGSLIGLYLVEEMGRFFKAIKGQRPEAFLRLFSVSPPEPARAALNRAGLSESDFEIRSASPAEIPAHLQQARLGLSFRKTAFAQIASSPTKIPEYLAAGIPVVCNAGIGDMDDIVEREQVGVVLHEFTDDAYQSAAQRALALADDMNIRDRCRRVAREHFDLKTVGGPRYINLYQELLAN